MSNPMDELAASWPASKDAYERACRVIPSGTVSRARILDPFPFLTAHASGSRIVDIDGNEYIDCAVGFGCHLLGHASPVVIDAIRDSVGDGVGYGTPHPREYRLAELLVEAIPCAAKVTFANSGSESTLNAIRIARGFTGKHGVAKFEGGYHGWYDSVLGSVGHDPSAAGPVEEPAFVGHSIGVPPENLANTYVLPFNHEGAFDRIRALKDRLALVMVEAVQGAGGAIAARPEWLTELRRVCTECDVLLLIDEIITGFRLAPGGAQEVYGVTADLATYSKAVGAGLPIGIIAGTEPVMKMLGTTGDPARDMREKVYYGGTFNGCVPAMAVGIAVLEHLRAHPEIHGQLNDLGERMREGLRQVVVAGDYPATVMGTGSLFMLRFVGGPVHSHRALAGENTAAYHGLYPRLLSRGVFMARTHFGLLSPAHSEADVDRVVEAHAEALADLQDSGLL